MELARAQSDASLNSLQDIDTFEHAVKMVGKADVSLVSNESLGESESHVDSDIILQLGQNSMELMPKSSQKH